LEQLDGVTQRAFDILTSERFVKALDVSLEDPKVRDRYGRGSSNAITDAGPDWNDQFLVARRLVEAGVRCVTLGFGGWDYRAVFATLYHNLGIDVETLTIEDSAGRPQRLLEGHRPVEELI